MAVMDIFTLIIIGSALVLLVKNPTGSASLITNSGNVIMGESKILTGTGYSGGN